jgi:hypothetical protein
MLEEALRDSAGDLALDLPLTDVIARGDRIRRGRQRRLALCGLAAAVVGATALSIALPQQSSPLLPAANAAWGPELVNMPADDLAEAGDVCRSALDGPGWRIPSGTQPLAAEARDSVAILYFRHGGMAGDCRMVLRDGAYVVSGASSGRWDELPAGTHVELASMGYSQDRLNAPVRDVAGALQVSDDVASVEIDAGGDIRDATVADGVAMFWLSDGFTMEEVDALTVTAYAADGTVLSAGPL